MSVQKCLHFPQRFDAQVNLLKPIDEPFSFATQSPSLRIPPSDPIPWIGAEVVIVQPKHALKGYQGVVKDVMCNQATPSGLRVQIQLTALCSAAPFERLTLDYEAVVEAK